MSGSLVWFRQDLRLHDNPALQVAVARGGPIVPVYILDDDGELGWAAGAASRWWLHHSLASLHESLVERGSRLVLRRGDSERSLRQLMQESGADAIYWNRRYELGAVVRDGWIKSELSEAGFEVKTFNAALLREPHAVANRQGQPFQ